MIRYESPTFEARARLIAKARRLRAEALADMATGFGRWLGATARRLLPAARRASRA